MYLKSLVLKGFKSFADRSVLTLEPGIIAVVGPNGSGKSNISDAVLWVLGERNAKNLRGQVMEDVIFAGSSARKSVSVAEVELVLDNSNGELPVDFEEVSIARRMYRDGTSEYLINGALARRLDVLDILHDTGLGAGTHSIISQGSLDSVLQSRPEDRRALVEETAGVLKHKQRKARSERRLEQMDQHLARVNDVTAEIHRQLGPLERKAKKAVAYQEYSEELEDLTIRLHVDSLKRLKAQWEKESAEENHLSSELETLRKQAQAAEAEAERLQELIREGNTEAMRVNAILNRTTATVGRLDSDILLLSEKRRVAESGIAELDAQLENNTNRRIEAEITKRHALKQLEETSALKDTADDAVHSLENELAEISARRAKLDAEFSERMRERRSFESKLERARRNLNEAQKVFEQQESRKRILEERVSALNVRFKESHESLSSQEKAIAELEQRMVVTQKTAKEAQDLLLKNQQILSAAQQERDRSHESVVSLRSQIQALQEIIAAQLSERSSALEDAQAALKNRGFASEILSLGIRVDEGFEELVERALRNDLSALILADAKDAESLAKDLLKNDAHGSLVAMVPSFHDFDATHQSNYADFGLDPLCAHISGREQSVQAARRLLANTYAAEDLHTALSALKQIEAGICVVCKDGSFLWPNGKIEMDFAQDEAGNSSMLSRSRRLSEVSEAQQLAEQRYEEAERRLLEAKAASDQAQDANFKAAEQLAQVKGSLQSAQSEYESSHKKHESIVADRERSMTQLEEAKKASAEAQPAAEELSKTVADMEVQFADMRQSISKLQDEVLPVRDQEATLTRSLSDAKISSSSLAERLNYALRTSEQRQRELDELKKSDEMAKSQIRVKSAMVARYEPIVAFLEAIRRNAGSRLANIQETAEQTQAASAHLHENAMDARDRARASRAALDAASARISELKISIGKLEVQVQTEISAIVEDCGLAVESALAYPAIEDREKAELDASNLKKRIHGLGVVNPSAAQEYEEVKERYDYLVSQLSDLNEARAALRAVDKAIDERMKDDFVRTFKEVNSNFAEIFAILFPGGSGSLTLVDPEDLEHTGIEVVAQPAGKKITKMSLMSGGEKSLVALALLFALYKTRSTPFYILDEVEAALDDSNLRRLLAYLEELCIDTQLIMITHQRRTMELANVLFGVSMQSDGVTKVISQKLDRALKYAQ